MRALLEADELDAHYEAARPAYHAAGARVRELQGIVYKPVPVFGLGQAAAVDHAHHVEELHAAQETETRAAAEMSRCLQALRAKQAEIAAMITPSAVDDVARRSIIARMTGSVS
jgi:hypothetical protein